MLRDDVHVSARTVARWILMLYRLGVRACSNLTLDVEAYSSYISPESLKVRVSLLEGDYPLTVFAASCTTDMQGPMEAYVFVRGIWICDLYRQVVLGLYNQEE